MIVNVPVKWAGCYNCFQWHSFNVGRANKMKINVEGKT